MNDSKQAQKPADYILDKFLMEHGVKSVSWDEFRRVLTDLRAAFAAEREDARHHAELEENEMRETYGD